MSTEEAAHRLGVKRQTVYAYVSRGLLTREPAPTGRGSTFDPAEVERLAGRARRAGRSGALEVVVETELTLLDPGGRLAYRGHDAVGLARHRTFEQVAALLWEDEPHEAWELPDATFAVVAALTATLPVAVLPAERIPVVVAALGATDPWRADRRPDAVRRAGRTILAGVLDGLPAPRLARRRTAAARLWAALADHDDPPRPQQLRALDAALVLLADHELAASTLAARVAASAWADPYRVVLAGLGPLGGALHGAAGDSAELLLRGLGPDARPEPVARALGETLARRGLVPGFGHRVYRDRDPRADHLLGLLEGAARDPGAARTVATVVEQAARRDLPAPNVDLALAGLSVSMGLVPGAPATVFTVARIAGLLAHAMEEYVHRLRFRPRAAYVGVAPRA